jgi:hypothetical protein
MTGDTGGPVFQSTYSADAGTGSSDDAGTDGGIVLPMALVGIVSNVVRTCPSVSNCSRRDTVASVSDPDNYDWLVGLGGSPVPALASFGAGK